MTKAICLKQCLFSYNKTNKLVINIDQLDIEKGERVFLYGPSGHGKSTLLNLTAGVLKANSGEVTVLGQDLTKLTQSKRDHLRGEKIGYIFQIFNSIINEINLAISRQFEGNRISDQFFIKIDNMRFNRLSIWWWRIDDTQIARTHQRKL